MKSKLILVFTFYFLGLLKIIDWLLFCNSDNNFKTLKYNELKIKYISRFPDVMKPLFDSKPELASVISFFIIGIAGYIFIKMNSKFYIALGFSAFLLAVWNLFSIM